MKANWIKKEDREPKEDDGQILVTNGNDFYEIVWHDQNENEYKKPHRFDKDDVAVFRKGNFTHWQHIFSPPSELKAREE